MTTTNLIELIESNQEAIENAITDAYRRSIGSEVHECLAIHEDGSLITWEYVGGYSCPEAVWNGSSFLICDFSDPCNAIMDVFLQGFDADGYEDEPDPLKAAALAEYGSEEDLINAVVEAEMEEFSPWDHCLSSLLQDLRRRTR